MLVRFSCENFKSFKEKAILDMTAINAYKEHDDRLIDIGTKEKYLKVAAVYGANASGKSNLFLGIGCFISIIVQSMNQDSNDSRPTIEKLFSPFALGETMGNTEFEIILYINGFEYQYGFEYNAEQIASEWMYRKSNKTNRMTVIFERDKDEIHFGAAVRGECGRYARQIPSETLVLTFFSKLKMKTSTFTEVFRGITSGYVLDTGMCDGDFFFEEMFHQVIDLNKDILLDFLKAVDTGIVDINYVLEREEYIYTTTHQDEKGNRYNLSLFDESAGTLKCIAVFSWIQIAISANEFIFIDELNMRLHPLLLKFIVDMFYAHTSSSSQLIYTTHDIALLDRRFFRRDQIWFTEKDEFGHSVLIPLSDYKVRQDASFEKDYLAGVYGGIPILRNFNMEVGE